MPTAYPLPPTTIYDNVRSYPDVITSDSWMKPFQRFSQPDFDFPRQMWLSPNAITALGEHNVGRFLELKALKDGWDFGRGKALSPDSLSTMDLFLRSYNSFPERCSLFLSARGNLELAWDAGDDMVNSLEFYPEHIAYYIEATDDEGEVSLTNIHALVQKLLSAKKNV